MKSFKQIQEMARKNPDKNPRIPAYQQLVDKGYDTKDYFLTFTRLKKVGINPASKYNTPNGIYCFPAEEILDIVKGNMNNVPHVNKAPYIHILKKKGRGIIDPLESYSASDYNKDVKKLYKMIIEKKGKLPINDNGRREIRWIIDEAKKNASSNTPIAWLWNVTKEISADAQIADRMGWKGATISGYKDWYDEEDKWDFKEGSDKKYKKKRKPRSERKGTFKVRSGVSYNSQGWNNLLRLLGYNGFVDRSGSGLIHANEPTQAVFLSAKSFDVIDMIENKSYEKLFMQDEIKNLVMKLEKKHNRVSISTVIDSKKNIDMLDKIADADIKGCEINFWKGDFYITGNGEISNFSNTGDRIRFNNITIRSGSFFHMDYIENCVISGGTFYDCKIDHGEIIGGGFEECSFTEPEMIQNANLHNCNPIYNTLFFKSKVYKNILVDCGFSTDCEIKTCRVSGITNKMMSNDSSVKFMDCDISNIRVLKGMFFMCRTSLAEIGDGDFQKGVIDNSLIKGGYFWRVKIRNTDVRGGNISNG